VVAWASWIDLRLGAVHDGAHCTRGSVCLRTALAAAGKDAALTRLPLNYSSAKVRVQLQDVIRANKVEDGCARIYLVWNTVGFWRSEEKMPEVDLVITSADVPAYPENAARRGARAWQACGFTTGGRENHFVAEQRLGGGRGRSAKVLTK